MNDIECTDADGSTIEWELLADPAALDEVDKDFEVDWENSTLIDPSTLIDDGLDTEFE